MSLPARINLVTLGVADVAASAAFYERLGWVRSTGASQEEVTFLGLNGIVLGLFGRAALAQDAAVADNGGSFNAVSLAINLPDETAVDMAFAAALEAGAVATKRPEKVFWGGYSGYFADPDGHLWELAFNPFFPLDEAGRIVLPA